jgi:hypothetical protein
VRERERERERERTRETGRQGGMERQKEGKEFCEVCEEKKLRKK